MQALAFGLSVLGLLSIILFVVMAYILDIIDDRYKLDVDRIWHKVKRKYRRLIKLPGLKV